MEECESIKSCHQALLPTVLSSLVWEHLVLVVAIKSYLMFHR